MINFDHKIDDHGINKYFADNGFQSLLAIKNLGSTLFFIIFYFLAWFMLLILKIISIFIGSIDNKTKKLKTKLMWNGTITLILSQFAPMIISSLINLS